MVDIKQKKSIDLFKQESLLKTARVFYSRGAINLGWDFFLKHEHEFTPANQMKLWNAFIMLWVDNPFKDDIL